MVMTTMMEALRLEHANIKKLLDLLESHLTNIDVADFDLVKSIADYLQTYPDHYHHPKEDLVYRALLEAEPELGASLDDLESEHLELAEHTEEFALAVERILQGKVKPGRWFNELAASFVHNYRKHMSKEDADFFPEAERVLEPAIFGELEAKVTDPSDPLFDQHAADRLAKLRANLGNLP
jgi:hemerythrin-like domain-containing protein